MTELLLGIDVGTSACKAAVVDARGVELAHGQVADAVGAGSRRAPSSTPTRCSAPWPTRRARRSTARPTGDAGRHRRDERGRDRDAARRRRAPSFTARSPGTTRAAPPRRRRSRATCPTSRSAPACPPARCARWPSSSTSATQGRGALAERRRVDRAPPRRPPGLRALALLAHRPARPRAPSRPTPTRSPGPACPATLLAELVLAGTDAGRSDGAALPGHRGRRADRGRPRPPRRRRRRRRDRARRRARLVRDRRGARARRPRRRTPPRAGAARRPA